ncbi:MAG: c-type cytochrome [Nevskiales bacterium]
MKKLISLSLLAFAGSVFAGDSSAPAASKSLEELTAPCAACHGPTGVSSSGAFPTIAGQHANYLEKALQDYQSGARKNPIMAGQVANLSKSDIEALAKYYAAQEGPLYTPTYK